MNKKTRVSMDNIDKKILNMLQEQLPFVEKPFEEIGKKVGLTGTQTMERVLRLKQDGIIRRIGPVLDPKKMGYASMLCAAAIPPEHLEEIALAVSAESSVTHNYERDSELNLWFTVTMKEKKDINRFISDLEKTYFIKIYRFPEKRTFKIKTHFILK